VVLPNDNHEKFALISGLPQPTSSTTTVAVGETEAARIMGELAPVGVLSLAAVLEAKGLCSPRLWISIAFTTNGFRNRIQANAAVKVIFAALPGITSPVPILKALTFWLQYGLQQLSIDASDRR